MQEIDLRCRFYISSPAQFLHREASVYVLMYIQYALVESSQFLKDGCSDQHAVKLNVIALCSR